jgi:hypothetical protein
MRDLAGALCPSFVTQSVHHLARCQTAALIREGNLSRQASSTCIACANSGLHGSQCRTAQTGLISV